jgi:hypothetical protein
MLLSLSGHITARALTARRIDGSSATTRHQLYYAKTDASIKALNHGKQTTGRYLGR